MEERDIPTLRINSCEDTLYIPNSNKITHIGTYANKSERDQPLKHCLILFSDTVQHYLPLLKLCTAVPHYSLLQFLITISSLSKKNGPAERPPAVLVMSCRVKLGIAKLFGFLMMNPPTRV